MKCDTRLRFCFGITILALFSACASKPQLYPNEKYKRVGRDVADRDIDECTKLADDYVSSGKGKDIAKGAGTGAVAGGAVGAVLGIFTHNVGGSAITGAAVGGTAGGVHGALSPDQVKHNFVNECLHERGYKVIGWN